MFISRIVHNTLVCFYTADRGIIMTFGSGSNGCLGHGNFNDVTQVNLLISHLLYYSFNVAYTHFCTTDKTVANKQLHSNHPTPYQNYTSMPKYRIVEVRSVQTNPCLLSKTHLCVYIFSHATVCEFSPR